MQSRINGKLSLDGKLTTYLEILSCLTNVVSNSHPSVANAIIEMTLAMLAHLSDDQFAEERHVAAALMFYEEDEKTPEVQQIIARPRDPRASRKTELHPTASR